MLKYKLFTIWIFLQASCCACSMKEREAGFNEMTDAYEIRKTGRLDAQINESSGLETTSDGNFWTHNDAGGANMLFKINAAGEVLEEVTLAKTSNKDWEDITRDDNGNLFIGDFGNNSNSRQNLKIYCVKEQQPEQTDTILFHYPDQEKFPPPKDQRNFDCEAFLWHNGNLYLFTKNRSKGTEVKIYKLPDQPGRYTAELIGSINTDEMITAADISPDGKLIALLGYGKIYMLEVSEDDVLHGKKYCVKFPESGQAEGLVFINNTDFIFTNEGGKIFKAVRSGNSKQ